MFAKLAVVIVGLTCIAAGLMSLRQEKMEISHDIAQAHREINDHRQSLWRLQSKVARQVEPRALHDSISKAGLELEPITPNAVEIEQSTPHPVRGPRVVDRTSAHRSTAPGTAPLPGGD